MLYTKETTGKIDEVVRKIEEAAAAHEFGVLGIHDLKEKMTSKGLDFGPACRVLDVCQPAQAKRVLDSNLAISTVLPCRISVYEEGGKIKVATIRPTALLGLFGEGGLKAIAADVEASLIAIMDAACS